MLEDSIKRITALVGVIVALLTTVLLLFDKTAEVWQRIIKPAWFKIMKPFLKFTIASATLVLPNAFMIGFPYYSLARFYWEIGSIDYIITNQIVFVGLITLQTVLVSLYSLLWGVFLYPRVRAWF
jgi:hypothetical protein